MHSMQAYTIASPFALIQPSLNSMCTETADDLIAEQQTVVEKIAATTKGTKRRMRNDDYDYDKTVDDNGNLGGHRLKKQKLATNAVADEVKDFL